MNDPVDLLVQLHDREALEVLDRECCVYLLLRDQRRGHEDSFANVLIALNELHPELFLGHELKQLLGVDHAGSLDVEGPAGLVNSVEASRIVLAEYILFREHVLLHNKNGHN